MTNGIKQAIQLMKNGKKGQMKQQALNKAFKIHTKEGQKK